MRKVIDDTDGWAFVPGVGTQCFPLRHCSARPVLEAVVRLPFSCFVFHVFIFGFQLVACHMPQCLIFMLRLDFDTRHFCFQDPGVDMPVLGMSCRLWPQGLLPAEMLKFCAALPPSVRMVDTCAWISFICVPCVFVVCFASSFHYSLSYVSVNVAILCRRPEMFICSGVKWFWRMAGRRTFVDIVHVTSGVVAQFNALFLTFHGHAIVDGFIFSTMFRSVAL